MKPLNLGAIAANNAQCEKLFTQVEDCCINSLGLLKRSTREASEKRPGLSGWQEADELGKVREGIQYYTIQVGDVSVPCRCEYGFFWWETGRLGCTVHLSVAGQGAGIFNESVLEDQDFIEGQKQSLRFAAVSILLHAKQKLESDIAASEPTIDEIMARQEGTDPGLSL